MKMLETFALFMLTATMTVSPNSFAAPQESYDTEIKKIAESPEIFERRLRALLGSLQRQRYRDALLPEDRSRSAALVAEFGDAPVQLVRRS